MITISSVVRWSTLVRAIAITIMVVTLLPQLSSSVNGRGVAAARDSGGIEKILQ